MGLQTEQAELLRSVNAKLDLLLAGPFKTGCYQLEDAQAARDDTDRRRLLLGARTSFTESLGQDHEPMRRSLAALHLAVIGLALASRDDAARNLLRAHIEALKALSGQQPKEPTSVRQRIDQRLNHRESQQRVLASEQRVLEFANALAETRRSWGSDAQQAPMVISHYGKDSAGQPEETRRRWRWPRPRNSRGGLLPGGLSQRATAYLWQRSLCSNRLTM